MSFSGSSDFQKQKLRGHQIGDVIVDRRADENDVILEQPGINIVGALAPVGLLDHHGNERCGARSRIVCLSHLEYFVRWRNPASDYFSFLAVVSIRALR